MEACSDDAPRQGADRRLQKPDQRQRVVAAALSRRDGVGYRVPAGARGEGWGAVTCGLCFNPLVHRLSRDPLSSPLARYLEICPAKQNGFLQVDLRRARQYTARRRKIGQDRSRGVSPHCHVVRASTF